MRTIKFRGKRIDGQGWVYGQLVKDTDGGANYIVERAYWNCEESPDQTLYYEAIPESVGQFVNRTDRWGKEVYVGDTVEGYYIDQIYGCSVSKVLIKIEQYEDVVKLDELDYFAVLMEVEL